MRRLGAESVAAIDPSESFVDACRRRNPGVDVKIGSAEELPYPNGRFGTALAQLVLHFVSDPVAAASEMRRVIEGGGIVAACVWDFGEGMTMLRQFWNAARTCDPLAPDEAETRRFGRDGEIAELFAEIGLLDITGGSLHVEAGYEDFDGFWEPFLTRTGPVGAYCAGLDAGSQTYLREELRTRLGSPDGPFTLTARAWYATGHA